MWFSILSVALNAWLVTRVTVRYRAYDTMLHRIEFEFPSICTSDCLNFWSVLLIAEAKLSFDWRNDFLQWVLVVLVLRFPIGARACVHAQWLRLNPIGPLRQLLVMMESSREYSGQICKLEDNPQNLHDMGFLFPRSILSGCIFHLDLRTVYPAVGGHLDHACQRRH
jgi:hypothetical protein